MKANLAECIVCAFRAQRRHSFLGFDIAKDVFSGPELENYCGYDDLWTDAMKLIKNKPTFFGRIKQALNQTHIYHRAFDTHGGLLDELRFQQEEENTHLNGLTPQAPSKKQVMTLKVEKVISNEVIKKIRAATSERLDGYHPLPVQVLSQTLYISAETKNSWMSKLVKLQAYLDICCGQSDKNLLAQILSCSNFLTKMKDDLSAEVKNIQNGSKQDLSPEQLLLNRYRIYACVVSQDAYIGVCFLQKWFPSQRSGERTIRKAAPEEIILYHAMRPHLGDGSAKPLTFEKALELCQRMYPGSKTQLFKQVLENVQKHPLYNFMISKHREMIQSLPENKAQSSEFTSTMSWVDKAQFPIEFIDRYRQKITEEILAKITNHDQAAGCFSDLNNFRKSVKDQRLVQIAINCLYEERELNPEEIFYMQMRLHQSLEELIGTDERDVSEFKKQKIAINASGQYSIDLPDQQQLVSEVHNWTEQSGLNSCIALLFLLEKIPQRLKNKEQFAQAIQNIQDYKETLNSQGCHEIDTNLEAISDMNEFQLWCKSKGKRIQVNYHQILSTFCPVAHKEKWDPRTHPYLKVKIEEEQVYIYHPWLGDEKYIKVTKQMFDEYYSCYLGGILTFIVEEVWTLELESLQNLSQEYDSEITQICKNVPREPGIMDVFALVEEFKTLKGKIKKEKEIEPEPESESKLPVMQVAKKKREKKKRQQEKKSLSKRLKNQIEKLELWDLSNEDTRIQNKAQSLKTFQSKLDNEEFNSKTVEEKSTFYKEVNALLEYLELFSAMKASAAANQAELQATVTKQGADQAELEAQNTALQNELAQAQKAASAAQAALQNELAQAQEVAAATQQAATAQQAQAAVQAELAEEIQAALQNELDQAQEAASVAQAATQQAKTLLAKNEQLLESLTKSRQKEQAIATHNAELKKQNALLQVELEELRTKAASTEAHVPYNPNQGVTILWNDYTRSWVTQYK